MEYSNFVPIDGDEYCAYQVSSSIYNQVYFLEVEILNYSEINQILIQNMIMGFSRDKKSSSNKSQALSREITFDLAQVERVFVGK